MTLHLIRLCVGVGEPAQLQDIGNSETFVYAGKPAVAALTRNHPRRAGELLAGGSLYWVMRGVVACRRRLLGVDQLNPPDGAPLCRLILDPAVVLTARQPRRAFQGWRYLENADAPADISPTELSMEPFPPTLEGELIRLGLL